MENLKVTLEFIDFEEMHNHQVDLIRLLQCGINSDIRNGAGVYTLFLIEQLANKSYEVGSAAIEKKQLT